MCELDVTFNVFGSNDNPARGCQRFDIPEKEIFAPDADELDGSRPSTSRAERSVSPTSDMEGGSGGATHPSPELEAVSVDRLWFVERDSDWQPVVASAVPQIAEQLRRRSPKF